MEVVIRPAVAVIPMEEHAQPLRIGGYLNMGKGGFRVRGVACWKVSVIWQGG